ncbi:hypothetical protein YC2023_052066 [Brassica napus]
MFINVHPLRQHVQLRVLRSKGLLIENILHHSYYRSEHFPSHVVSHISVSMVFKFHGYQSSAQYRKKFNGMCVYKSSDASVSLEGWTSNLGNQSLRLPVRPLICSRDRCRTWESNPKRHMSNARKVDDVKPMRHVDLTFPASIIFDLNNDLFTSCTSYTIFKKNASSSFCFRSRRRWMPI